MLSIFITTQESTLRTLRGGNIISIDKPQMVVDYTANMGGVDPADEYASTYCLLRKSLKWWIILSFSGLEMCVINSFILYRISEEGKQQKPMTHHEFVKGLVKQLRDICFSMSTNS
uniref:PiggyBac transposable element-derived protein domain-containing protein n=1 Tax=Glossina palpalis gambiensis TaxID=67801 RepID=A0A1B0BVD5_9MUSC